MAALPKCTEDETFVLSVNGQWDESNDTVNEISVWVSAISCFGNYFKKQKAIEMEKKYLFNIF